MRRFWRNFRDARNRWKAKTPLAFKRVIKTCLGISSTALAVNMALQAGGAAEPEWWGVVYPYLIGFPAGMAAVAKFTQTYDSNGHPVSPEKEPEDT